MIGLLLPRLIIAALALVLLLGRTASAQTPVVPTSSSDADLAGDIAEYEDTLKKIRDEKWIYVPMPGGGVLIDRDQEAGLFSHMILLGQMSPASVASMHRQLREGTRYLQTTIESSLENLYRRRDGVATPPPVAATPPTTPPDMQRQLDQLSLVTWRGRIQGTWSVDCQMERHGPFSLSGPFDVTFAGNATIDGTFRSSEYVWPVEGSISTLGEIFGSGTNTFGSFMWGGISELRDRVLYLTGPGTLSFTVSEPGTIRRPGTWSIESVTS